MALPIYLVIYYFAPDWISSTWLYADLSGPTFLQVPIEDYLWYFMVGASLSTILPIYNGQHFHWRFKK